MRSSAVAQPPSAVSPDAEIDVRLLADHSRGRLCHIASPFAGVTSPADVAPGLALPIKSGAGSVNALTHRRCGVNRNASRIAIVLVSVVFLGTCAWGQVKPIPKPVAPPSPNPATPPPAAPGNERQSIPPDGDVPAPENAPLARFVDGQTIGAVRIDLKGLDLKAIREWVVQGVQNLRKTEKEVGRAQGDVGQEFDKLSEGVEKFRKAGADQMYWVFSLDDLTGGHPPFAVVPLAKGQGPGPIETEFKSMPGGDRLMAAVMGHALVFGAPATIERLKAAAPMPRIELARAFDAAGTGQVRIALIPQEGPRKAFEKISADLPNELGGGPIQTVSRGLSWMSVSIAFPPDPALHLLIQSPDPQTAAKLNDVITHAINWARDRKEGPRDELAFTQMVGQLQPKLEGDRITVNLPPADIQKLASMLAGQMMRAKNGALRTRVMSNLRHLSFGVTMYANDHQGAMPKDLGAEVQKYLGPNPRQLWIDPLRPNDKKPYVYLKLADKLTDVTEPARAVMIYENHTTWDNGVNAAFADGHAEWFANEKQFEAAMKVTKRNNPNAVEMPQ
jgi:prepilin-type processing-associated H-X9-DG protein